MNGAYSDDRHHDNIWATAGCQFLFIATTPPPFESGVFVCVQQFAYLHTSGIILGASHLQSRFLHGRTCLVFVHGYDIVDLILVLYGFKQSATNLNFIRPSGHGARAACPRRLCLRAQCRKTDQRMTWHQTKSIPHRSCDTASRLQSMPAGYRLAEPTGHVPIPLCQLFQRACVFRPHPTDG